jgi:signal transduction histidine kinase/DNA-binding response OmpR family regulator
MLSNIPTENALKRLFPGDSEMAQRMREFDWAQSSLGAAESWPQSLRTALGICLTSRFPLHLYWGTGLTLFYNDSCIPLLGPAKYPALLGRSGQDAWAGVWDSIGPMIENIFSTGEAGCSEDIPVFFDRDLPREVMFATFSFSPVYGSGDRIDGVFCTCTETAGKPASDRRLETLLMPDSRVAKRDGVGLAGAVRALPDLKNLPIILSSARAGEESRAESLHAGADDYRVRPFSAREVTARVATHLKHSARRQLATENAALQRLHEASARLISEDALPTLLQAVIDAAITVTDAAMGTLQLYEPVSRSLHIVAQRGFSPAFLDHFKVVQADDTVVCGQALRHNERVLVEDVSQSPLFLGTPAMHVLASEGVRAVQSTPMRARDGQLLGMIATHWTEPHRPDKSTLRILDLLAREAADLIEHRQREKVLHESEARLAAESEALARLNNASSRLWRLQTLEEGLNEMLAATIQLLGADKGHVQILAAERGVLHIVAQRGFETDFLDFFREVSIEDDSACGQALRSGKRILIEDIESEPSYAPYRQIARAAGYRAVQSTPLLSPDGTLLGMLSTYCCLPQRPGDTELRCLDLYARQAADFIERCQTDQALRESRAQLQEELSDTQLLQSVSAELLHENDIQILYEKIIDAASKIMRSDYASMHMLHPEQGHGGELQLLAYRGFNSQTAKFWEWVSAESSGSTCGMALSAGRRAIATDVEQCGCLQSAGDPTACLQTGICACQRTPLYSRRGKLVGILSTHWRQPHQLSERDWHLLDILARQAADLIDRKWAEEALRLADRRKDEFLAMLAHELRNPLAPISNALHILRMPNFQGSTTGLLDMMERQTTHLVRLVDDLLEISRVTTGKIELKKERSDLAAILSHAQESTRQAIQNAHLQLTVSLPPERLMLDADPVRLTQVFANLLNNAAKYTDAGGRIAIHAERKNSEAVVSVRDTGIGISSDMLPRVFDLFTQVDQMLDRARGGLGIGLALVRSLVELHGGRVEARSDGLGQGSEFVVHLLLAKIESADLVVNEKSPLPLSPVRILVTDDHTDAADSLALMLTSWGNEVRVAYNGPATLELISSFVPAVVLLDLGMPGMSGYEVAGHIRQSPDHENMRLIALTGWGQLEDRRRTREAGFDHHLTKPVDIHELQKLLALSPKLK